MTPVEQFIERVSKDLVADGWTLGVTDQDRGIGFQEGPLADSIRKHVWVVASITPDRVAELQNEIAETTSRLTKLKRELKQIVNGDSTEHQAT